MKQTLGRLLVRAHPIAGILLPGISLAAHSILTLGAFYKPRKGTTGKGFCAIEGPVTGPSKLLRE